MLCKTIANILTFERQYDELIIVDQTKEHDNQTRKYLEELVLNNKIKYIYIDYPNLPNARNTGIEKAMGDIVVFFDDDVEINENTIPSHVSGFTEQNIGCVTGKVTICNTSQNGNKVLENKGTLIKIIKSLLFIFLRKKAAYVGRLGVLSNFSGDRILPSDTCIGCNMSFRKEVLIKCGLFDDKYSGSAVREDTDMSVRLRRCGYKIMYIPQAAVVHFMDNTGGTRTDASETYWHTIFKNQCYFYLKNFKYSRLMTMFIQMFDLLRCGRQGLKAITIFSQAYRASYDDVIAKFEA
jgi:GT2 family glycosyltransferase